MFTGCEPWVLTHVLLYLFLFKGTPSVHETHVFHSYRNCNCLFFAVWTCNRVFKCLRARFQKWRKRKRRMKKIQKKRRVQPPAQRKPVLQPVSHGSTSVPPMCGRRYSRSFNGIVTARRPNSYQFSVCSHLSSRWVLLSCLSKSLLSIKSFSIGRARGTERERENLRNM